jgi:hypothetical protein
MTPIFDPEGEGLTFKELREEFLERGFDDFNEGDARVKRWANRAYHELCEEKPWPFLATSTIEGAAPLEVDDLAHVLGFADVGTGAPLTFADERELTALDPTLARTGPASRWFQASGALSVWPEDASGVYQVRYTRLPQELEADDDRLAIPARYQEVVIDGMAKRAYKNRDNFEAAAAVTVEWERGVRQMVRALLRPNYDTNRKMLRTGAAGDYAG